jgi:hypothetical protein
MRRQRRLLQAMLQVVELVDDVDRRTPSPVLPPGTAYARSKGRRGEGALPMIPA